MDAENLGDGLAGFAIGHGLHRPLAAAFQFLSGSNWSAHTRLDGATRQGGSFTMLGPVMESIF